ncbi:hypothetical protein cypCar_00042119 [Cyprinus carpio]|nr:hypothetical protein cypCar_00042119 [Cyprinus carpio]
MALKVTAHLTWDLNLLEKGLTIPVLNMLLNEFLCVSRVPPGVKHVDLDLSTLPPTTAMAVLIYNRWMSLVQQEKELTENILSVLREQATDSITVLEGALNIKKDFYIHTLRSLDLLAADPSTANGETESSTAGLRISADHLHCQLDSSASLCCVDEQQLAGYWSACKTLTETSDPGESQHTPYGQISCFMRNHDYGALIEAFIRDNVTLSLPHSFRHSIQLELLHKLQQGCAQDPWIRSTASTSVNISQLEQQLILSLDPRHIRQILIELHGMAERPFWRVNSKWEVPVDYVNVILAIKDNLTRDLVYILMAKGLHCISIKDFAHARQLFTACLELVTEFSPKLRQVMLNELLLMEVRGHEAGAAEGNMERPPPDLVSRVRGYLEMRIHDLPLRQIVGEECVVFMLNWRENEYLTLQVPQSLVNSNPYIKLGQLIASTCKELPGPKESRRTAKELWEVVVQICSVSSQHKRSSDGRVSLLKQRESSMGILPRSKFMTFMKKLREPLVLTTLISLFVRLHNIVRDDIVNEVTAEHISIWPSSLANDQPVFCSDALLPAGRDRVLRLLH